MLECLYHTVFGAWLVFIFLGSAWTLGLPIMLLPVLMVLRGYQILGTVILTVFSFQWVLPLKPWLGFRRTIRNLDPTGYFKECRLVLLDEEDLQKENSMICFHPHGVFSMGFNFCGIHHPEFAEGRHGDFVYLVAGILTKMPFVILVCEWMGNIQSAGKKNMLRLLKARKNIAFLPGGFQEATLTQRGCDRIWLKQRLGFIKYALIYGYRVHPCYVFGETNTYTTFQPFLNLRLLLNDFSIPGVLFFGDWRFPLLPRPETRIVTVVGKGLEFPRMKSITEKDIQNYHDMYVKALTDLFESQKVAAGYPDACLEIW